MASTTQKLLITILTLTLHISTSFSTFTPLDNYLINCGSQIPTPDSNNRIFTPDTSFLISPHTLQFQSAAPSPLYSTSRAFSRPALYSFPIRDLSAPHHLLRLHFHPLQNTPSLSVTEFHVIANGFLLLRNFRVPNFSIVKEFLIPIKLDKLEITFLPSVKSEENKKYGYVNAIEVISVPRDLIADVAMYVVDNSNNNNNRENEMVNGLLVNGYENVHRVNVGGFKVTPFNDSLSRTWVTDEGYLEKTGTESYESVHFGGRINYRTGGASREVGPDNVYNTARVLRSSGDLVTDKNMTFVFGVERGYEYLVRLHFCDIASVSMRMLFFNVYVNGDLVVESLDLSRETGWVLASPFYVDFVVGMRDKDVLVVSVGASNMSLPRAVDAILNGVEVSKINNTMRSFDGEVCAGVVWGVWRKEHVSVLLPLVAAVFLLLSAGMLVRRRRGGGSVGWSRLPVDVSEDNFKLGNQFSSVKA